MHYAFFSKGQRWKTSWSAGLVLCIKNICCEENECQNILLYIKLRFKECTVVETRL